MGLLSVFYIAVASVAFFAFFLQLFLSFVKRGDKLPLLISLVSFFVFIRFGAVFFCSTGLNLPSHHFTLLRCHLVFSEAVMIFMLSVFFYLLKNTKKKIMILQLSILVFILFLCSIIPDRLFFGNNETVYFDSLAYDEKIKLTVHGFSWWRVFGNIYIILFTFFTVLILFKKSNIVSNRANNLFVAGLCLILAAGIYDNLVDYSLIHSIYVLPFAIFTLYMIINFVPYTYLLKEIMDKDRQIEQGKKWRTLLNEAEIIVLGLNRMGHVEYVNSHFIEISGYTEDEILGKDWFEFFIPPEEHYNLQGAFIEILDFEFHHQYMNPVKTKNGKELMIRWFNVRTRDENDKITGVLSIGVDMSNEIRDKETLKEKLQEAESLIEKFNKQGNQSPL